VPEGAAENALDPPCSPVVRLVNPSPGPLAPKPCPMKLLLPCRYWGARKANSTAPPPRIAPPSIEPITVPAELALLVPAAPGAGTGVGGPYGIGGVGHGAGGKGGGVGYGCGGDGVDGVGAIGAFAQITPSMESVHAARFHRESYPVPPSVRHSPRLH
jgi:hypothetical protein